MVIDWTRALALTGSCLVLKLTEGWATRQAEVLLTAARARVRRGGR